eukprot:TRINITY_DN14085_c1_g1_i1.p1 TRINITY_DN14085_c1_g1~~TRINITY_DN14085_c1_g1_i1.p1  ORF type:complete len:168 (-),score=15.28 TRINITY_DN14085_c1_g1_i1:298-801(-)
MLLCKKSITKVSKPYVYHEGLVLATLCTLCHWSVYITFFIPHCFLPSCRCSICLGEYKDREKLRMLPTCGHNFHLTCIDIWLQRQSTCPICRLSLHGSSEARSTMSSTTFGGALQTVDTPDVVRDHSSEQLRSPESSSHGEHNHEHRGSVPRNLESEIAREAETGHH